MFIAVLAPGILCENANFYAQQSSRSQSNIVQTVIFDLSPSSLRLFATLFSDNSDSSRFTYQTSFTEAPAALGLAGNVVQFVRGCAAVRKRIRLPATSQTPQGKLSTQYRSLPAEILMRRRLTALPKVAPTGRMPGYYNASAAE